MTAAANAATRQFSTSLKTLEKSKRLPSFANVKAIELEKFKQEIRELLLLLLGVKSV